jgi:hypothetical protein
LKPAGASSNPVAPALSSPNHDRDSTLPVAASTLLWGVPGYIIGQLKEDAIKC